MPAGDVILTLPNLQITYAVGDLERGGVTTPGGVVGRRANEFVVPEFAHRNAVVDGRGSVAVNSYPNQFESWTDTASIAYVEFLCRLPDDTSSDPDVLLQVGRAFVISLKTMLDVKYGSRLLGLPWLEEIGEVFDDWYWIRRLGSPSLSNEAQLRLIEHSSKEFYSELEKLIKDNVLLPIDQRRRFELASHWYWFADAEMDPVNKFVQLWIVIEGLLMLNHSDTRPVKRKLAELLGSDEGTSTFVGRLYRVRGALVHGNVPSDFRENLEKVEALARLLLAEKVGDVSARPEIGQIREWVSSK